MRRRVRVGTGQWPHGQLDAFEGDAVVHHARARLGHAPGGDHVGGQGVGGFGATEQDEGEDRGVQAGQRSGHQRYVRHRSRAAHGLHRLGVEARHHHQGGAAVQGAGDHRESTDVGEGQAGQPGVAGGIHAEACRGGAGGRRHGLVRQDHPFGSSRRARCGQDQCVALFDTHAAGQRALRTVGADDPRRAQGVEEGLARRMAEARIERCRGVPGVPDGPEGVDKPRSTWEVECDELGHRTVA